MASKDQGKKNFGQGKGNNPYKGNKNPGKPNVKKEDCQEGKSSKNNNQGRANQNPKVGGNKEETQGRNSNRNINQEKSNQPSNSAGKKENIKVKQNKNFVQQGQQKGSTSDERHHQTVSQTKTSINIGLNTASNLLSQKAGFLNLALNALSHMTLSVESTTVNASSSSTFQSNNSQPGRPAIQNRGNRRGVGRKPVNVNNPQPSSKVKSDAPAQLRVFSGNQESKKETVKDFRPRGNMTRNRFHKPGMPRIPGMPCNPTSGPQIKFKSPNQTNRVHHSLQNTNFRPPLQHRQPVKPEAAFQKHGYNTAFQNTNRHSSESVLVRNPQTDFYNKFGQTSTIPEYNLGLICPSYSQDAVQNVYPTRAPIYKKKNRHPSKNTNQPSKIIKQSENIEKPQSSNKPRRRQKKQDFWKSDKTVPANKATPLLSFQRILPNKSIEKKTYISSDDDTVSLSRCSSDESIWTTTVSDDAVEGSSSDESDTMSEISLGSSFKDSGIVSHTSDLSASTGSNTYKVIAYYWDIENCPVPHQKSPTDFIKRVRETFNKGRSEFEFTAVCDVTRLNEIIAEELDKASVNMMHVSYVNKNAADAKIKSLLAEFPDKCRGSQDNAVVLISGDYDFANTLNSLKYKYQVKVYLLCRNNARHSLVESSDEHRFYEDFIKDLPTRIVEKKKNFFIILSNFSDTMKSKQIKKFANDKMKGLNCRVTVINGKSAEIVFPNEFLREKALLLLKDCTVGDHKIQLTLSENEVPLVIQGSKTDKQIKLKTEPEKKLEKVKKSSPIEVKEDSSANKGAVLCVCVCVELGNVNFWKIKFEQLWDTTEFELKWDGSNDDGCFLANFPSLSKAQKAKKILQKSQKNDPSSPKFLKLIKQDTISLNLSSVANFRDIKRLKIEEHTRIVESKKELCLTKHKANLSELKLVSSSSISGVNEAVNDKHNELNEQKVNFLNFTSNTLDQIKNLDITSDTVDKELEFILRDYTRECNSFSSFLPIYAKKNIILKKIKKHQIVIIRAETGSGKSTQLAQYLWRDQAHTKKEGMIICTQPRKIAAITLAKHVSSQVGCSLGDIVGYQVGITHKKSPNTSILYMTDVTMLKMLVNEDFKNVSCVIVDEAHERTVYTDLLLGMIKNCLKSRPDLKLIITSATIDTSVFVDYFQLQNDCVLEVSGRTFPVEDVWLEKDVSLNWNYFSKAIDIVFDILNQEKEGDILVFLTTPFETEKAMKAVADKLTDKLKQNVKVLQLHGKLDMTEQQKVFERLSNGMRKIVFATNCAETSITIPGIKYVVDCGFVKGSQYDARRNMNVMSVNFVSQSSSEQRRGRAGRTQIGKCFHLYSKSNFDKMIKNSDPEILRCNLGNAILKLMKIGVKNPIQFDFVQSPSKDALEYAMKQLVLLQAVKEDDLSLTKLGEIISCLPLEPRLGHLIIKGIENDIGFESVVLAALITISRNIFFRTSDNKTDADIKKMRFCQSESDFVTFFDIYKEWSSLPKQAKNKWCVLNCINARSMRTAQDLINEITHILDKEVNIKVMSKFSVETVHEILLKIIFLSFRQNLCIFSGHPKFGYKSIDIPDSLLIHPSSSLYTYGNWRPQFLVYDSILRTDKTYLINVSPVSDTILSEYGGQIPLESLQTLPLHTYSISPVGKIIILHDIIGKQGIQKRNIESTLKRSIESDSVAIDIDIPKGEIKIYAPQLKEDLVQSTFCPLISKAQEQLLAEEKEVIIDSHLCLLASAGAEIKDVILPGEFRDLKVILKNQTEITSVVEKLQTCGTICTVHEFKHYSKITFASPLQAKLALQLFQDDESFSLQKIIKANTFDNRANQYKIFVSCFRRKCNGSAFITIDPPTAVSEVLRSFCFLHYKNSRLQVSLSKKTQDIKIQGLPNDVEHYDFRQFLNLHLPENCKITKCLVARVPEYESSNLEIQSMKQKFFDLFVQFTSKEKLLIDIKKPSSKDTKWNAFVFFKNCHDGETSVTVLKNKTAMSDIVGLNMKPTLQTFLYCKLEVFTAVKPQVEEALEFFKSNSSVDKTLEITVVPKGDNGVQIQITSNNVSDITDARRAILNCLLGDQISCEGNEALEKLFSKSGRVFLKEISDKPDCYIEINVFKKVLTIFANESVCNLIKMEINEYLEKLEAENFTEINLMPDNGKPGVLRTLLKNYGYDLKQLKEICDGMDIQINTQEHVLYVKGSSTSISKCQDIISDLKEKLEDTPYNEDAELCPICSVEVSDKYHRLEYCGHAYCNDCLLHLFQSSDDFPLCCILCGAHIVLADFNWASKEAKLSENEVFKKSLQIFIQNREDISFCPSSDCPMIFRKTVDENVFECPSCNNSICTRCEELYHYGMSCSLYHCSKEDDDYSLKTWIQENPENRKLCPICSSPIEKNGGCNHMTCWKCKSHMCWLCLQVFLSADLVYDHQPNCPKSSSSLI